MRPDTLSEAAERIVKGEPAWKAIGEFLDVFYGSASPEERLAKIRDEPPLTGDDKLDAVIGAAAEYLAKLYRLRWPSRKRSSLHPQQKEYPSRRRAREG
jgi:hypothetical protein